MITNGFYSLETLKGEYKNKGVYKNISKGLDYYEGDKEEFLVEIIAKIKPFKMNTLLRALQSALTRIKH